MASKKSAADKVFDVAKPGTSTPDIGSKPMIVGHKSMASDPMVRESAAKEAATGSSAADTEIKPQPTKIKIQPLGDEEHAEEFAVSKDQTETSAKSEAAEAVTQDTKATEEAVADDRETTGTTTTETESKSDESQNSDDIKQKNETPGSEESADDKAKVDPAVIESERDENVKKLIASKKYRLNIKETKERSSKNTVFAGVLILVVALAGLYLLVDTGKLNIGFEVPFHVLGTKKENEITNVPVPAETIVSPTQEQKVPASEDVELSQTEKDKATIPAGFVAFDGSKYGFSLAYPAEFGDIVAGEELNGRVGFSFSKESNFFISVNKKDRVGPSGHDSPTLNLQGFKALNSQYVLEYLEPDSKEIIDTATHVLYPVTYVANSPYIVFEGVGIGYFAGSIAMIQDDQTYQSVVIDYTAGSIDQAFTASDTPVKQLDAIMQTFRSVQ